MRGRTRWRRRRRGSGTGRGRGRSAITKYSDSTPHTAVRGGDTRACYPRFDGGFRQGDFITHTRERCACQVGGLLSLEPWVFWYSELYPTLVPRCDDRAHWISNRCLGCATRFVRSHHGAQVRILHFRGSRNALAFDDGGQSTKIQVVQFLFKKSRDEEGWWAKENGREKIPGV